MLFIATYSMIRSKKVTKVERDSIEFQSLVYPASVSLRIDLRTLSGAENCHFRKVVFSFTSDGSVDWSGRVMLLFLYSHTRSPNMKRPLSNGLKPVLSPCLCTVLCNLQLINKATNRYWMYWTLEENFHCLNI